VGEKASVRPVKKTTEKKGEIMTEKSDLYHKLAEEFGWVKTYSDYPKLKAESVLVCSDFHLPYIHIEFTAWMMAVAKKQKIKNCLIAGDFFDQNMYSFFLSEDTGKWDDEKRSAKQLLKHMLRQFDSITMLLGNHDARILRRLDYLIKYADVMAMVSRDKRIRVSGYAKATVNGKWLVVHPKCYSRIAPQKERRLAEKHHLNLIGTHGHLTAAAFDISGQYWTAQIGGNVDYDKVEYVSQQVTDHPRWVKSFVILQKSEITGNTYPKLYCERDQEYEEYCAKL